MIEAIIKALKPVFDGLDWVDQYGGLVETWTRFITGENDIQIPETFPVAIGTDPGCGDDCLYLLTPNDAKKNVLFWSLTSDPTVGPVPANYSRAFRPMQTTQTARLHVWLNLSQCDTCDSTTFLAYMEYLKNALDRTKVQVTSPIKIKADLKLVGAPTRDHREVWGPWTFGQDQKLFVHPFDFFALDITFAWIQNQVCPIVPTC